MSATATDPATAQLRKKAKVTAAVDLRGVPEGTPGRVMLVDGFSWVRYWVRFDNGVELGSVRRDQLVTKEQLEAVSGADDEAVEEAGEGGAAAGGGDDAGAGGGVATPSGTLVPQKLLDRSKAARARLGG